VTAFLLEVIVMFTRKQYEQVAQVLAETSGKYEATVAGMAVEDTRNYIANELADMFAEDNPRFNRKLFMEAAKAESYQQKKAQRAARKREVLKLSGGPNWERRR
jgi:hypothetical protein